MLGKIKNPKIQKYIKLLSNPRALGLLAFGAVAIMVTWSGIRAVQANYDLQKEISRLEQQNEVQRLENENLKLKNEYYKTDEFLNLAARRQFGLAAPGETVLVVPKSVALAHTVDLSPEAQSGTKEQPPKPAYQKNLDAWLDFFFNR
jgi:cell division protein FtsB